MRKRNSEKDKSIFQSCLPQEWNRETWKRRTEKNENETKVKAKKTITLDRMKDNESEKGDGKSDQGTETKLEHGGKKEEEEMDAQNQIKEMQRKIEASLETLRSIGISESEEGSFIIPSAII